jgi:hypothetical protein
MSDTELNMSREITESNARLPLDMSQVEMPLDVTIRSAALSIAQRHCGDTTVKEGNLYQQLKMDNKLVGPLTVEHVIRCALIFEMYLWGKWSQDIAGKAMEQTLDELDNAIKGGAFDKHVAELKDEPPVRPHSG